VRIYLDSASAKVSTRARLGRFIGYCWFVVRGYFAPNRPVDAFFDRFELPDQCFVGAAFTVSDSIRPRDNLDAIRSLAGAGGRGQCTFPVNSFWCVNEAAGHEDDQIIKHVFT
jgi:hypothetical protein